jgi:hypothetical protein
MSASNTLNDMQFDDSKNIRLIDEFLDLEIVVSANEYDYVLSYFKKVMKDPTAAENFTMSVYQVSRQTAIPVLEIVESLKGRDGIELTATIAYYLNGTRSPATLLGVKNIVQPNFYAARNVLI